MGATGSRTKFLKCLLFLFNFVFWVVGFALLALGLWLILDPRRNYVLHFVDISEHEPLLNYAAFIFIGVGASSILFGFVGCCGALREIQCLLTAFMFILIVILCGELIAGLLGVVWYTKFNTYMPYYLYNMTTYRYGREKWVTQLLDTVQFYQKCCGYNGSYNYFMSYWQITYSGGTLYNVPQSCCVQRQEAYPPNNIAPVDDWCQFYAYNSTGQRSAVYTQGCYTKLMAWFEQTSLIFMAVGFGTALFQMLGILLSLCLCRRIGSYYKKLEEEETTKTTQESTC